MHDLCLLNVKKDSTRFCRSKYASKKCVFLSLNYTTSERQCPKDFMLRWLWTFFTLIVSRIKRVVGEHDDTTTKQASVSEGQKVHTPSTLALNRFSETSPIRQHYRVWRNPCTVARNISNSHSYMQTDPLRINTLLVFRDT